MRRRIFHFSFSTFNSAALWGTNTVWGPAPVTNRTWSFDFGHRVATHGERASVRVWDDANHNGEKDSDETGDTYTFWLRGHTMNVTNELSYGSFDRDRDNLPDWWEVQQGLSMNGVKEDEYADPDNDGLINLHEFWAGTNPLVPDGSNTLLSVCARSVDDRIRNIVNPEVTVDRFVDFVANGRNGTFVTNSNFWARGLCGWIIAICLATCSCDGMSPRERAETYGASANVSIRVVDDDCKPIANVFVEVYYSLSVREGQTVKGESDVNGGFRSLGKTTGDILIRLRKDGYYPSDEKIELAASKEREVKFGRWKPDVITTNIVLRKILKPVKLITPEWSKGFLIPQGGVAMGLDLEKQDWVKPWGNGEVADFEVTYKSDGKRRFEYSGANLKINFIRPFDGAYPCKLNKTSALRTVYHAKTNNTYQSELVYWEERDQAGKFIRHVLSEDEYLVLRTRSKVDKDGKFIGGQYSMIIGGIAFGWSNKAFGAIHFHSHVNPTFNDPNLEEMNIYNTPNFRAIGGLPKKGH